jgi:hypothetical protein
MSLGKGDSEAAQATEAPEGGCTVTAEERLAPLQRNLDAKSAAKLSGQEVLLQFTALMGPQLGPFFQALDTECFWLRLRWLQYTTLFATDSARVQLLNQTAGLFLRIVQLGLWELTVLHLCRITDNAKTSNNANLTIQGLAPLVHDQSLRGEVHDLVATAVQKTKFARQWRNKQLAHTDLFLALGKGAEPLPAGYVWEVNEAIDSVVAVMNRVDAHFKREKTPFDFSEEPGYASDLLYFLREGLVAEDGRKKRLLEGRDTEEDRRPRPDI